MGVPMTATPAVTEQESAAVASDAQEMELEDGEGMCVCCDKTFEDAVYALAINFALLVQYLAQSRCKSGGSVSAVSGCSRLPWGRFLTLGSFPSLTG